jgi:predicted GIY-YIG superfamily endonuclease
MQFYFVHIFQSKLMSECFYVGSTEGLCARLKQHNAGEVPRTVKFRPRHIKTAIVFNEQKRAVEFECYIKTASGRAFAKRRF